MAEDSKIAVFIALGCFAMFTMIILIIIFAVRYQNKLLHHRITLEKRRQIEIFNAAIEAEDRQKDLIARNLHDTINPNLSLVMRVLRLHNQTRTELGEPKDSIVDCEELIEECMEGIRVACYNLSPQVLKNLGLVKAIEHLAAHIHNTKAALCIFKIDERANHLVSKIFPKHLNIFRVTQEVLNNILKHSNSTEINIHLFEKEGSLKLIINYDGIGLKSELLPELRKKGLGLNSIDSRLLMIDGKISYSSDENKNSTNISIPMTIN